MFLTRKLKKNYLFYIDGKYKRSEFIGIIAAKTKSGAGNDS